ncbi:hypothetical protein Q5762_09450 [Streptomyces sp. P9(2023)]|uniref:hypothetical protein n=1 Tax=Streptomyces sp. P9(2023) TaxID=3064394 RepID=UPI0028F3EF72|nr:hypothetical protein [Streptomyces sp. P9(2023)]MDT9688573.1 hypothetical protein [Streptomyces sp. P9(2023)]
MNLRSSWVAETGQTREDTRLTQTGATTMLNPVQVRSGILPGSYSGQFRLSGFWMTNASAMSATVSEGRAVVQGEISQGVYPVTLPASQTVTFTPGNPQYGRVDLVVLRIYDRLYEGQRNEAVVEVIEGVPEQTPKAMPVPARSLPLYEVTVPAGVSAGNGGIPWATALKDLRTPVVAVGGIVPAEGPVAPGAYPGQYQDTADGQFQRWDGGKWVSYPAGIGGIIPASAGTLPASYTGQYRESALGQLQRWNGSAWLPAVPGPAYNDTLDHGTTSSTTYTPILAERAVNPLTVNFTAPPSKTVLIGFGARIQSTSPDHYAYVNIRVTQGTTVVLDSTDDERAAVCASEHNTSVATSVRLGNLTPGLTYTVTVVHRVVANTLNLKAGFDNVFVRVDPLA